MNKLNSKEMELQKLLKQAHEKYPRGTVFKNLATGNDIISSGKFAISQDMDNIFDSVNSDIVYAIFDTPYANKWAEIVSKPNTETYHYGIIHDKDCYPYMTGTHKDLELLKDLFKNANVIEWRSIDINLTDKQNGDNG